MAKFIVEGLKCLNRKWDAIPPSPRFSTKDTRKVTTGNFSKSKIQNPKQIQNPNVKQPNALLTDWDFGIGILFEF